MISKVVIPDLGATGDDVLLNKWLVKPGDLVKAGEPLFLVETDKALVEVEAFRGGYIREILVSEESEIPVGEAVAIIADAMEETIGAISIEESVEAAESTTEQPRIEGAARGRVLASPLARRIAKELVIDLSAVKGTGEGGRIKKRDVLAAAKMHEVSAPKSTPLDYEEGAIKRIPVSPMRSAIAARTRRSKSEAPHFYVSAVIDMTEAMSFRQQTAALAEKILPQSPLCQRGEGGISPSLTDFAIRAVALALRETPQLNASFQGDEILHFADIHLGFVVGLSEGMIVPVIRHADRRNLYTLAAMTRRLREKATARKLSEKELTGSTFTISNLGMFGVDSFVAVINPPEAAILALGAVRQQPAVWEGKVVPRELMTATLSADHRLVDGITAAQFLGKFKELLENPILLALEPPTEENAT